MSEDAFGYYGRMYRHEVRERELAEERLRLAEKEIARLEAVCQSLADELEQARSEVPLT
jgi:hypothetical protein